LTDLVAGKYAPENTVPVLSQLLAKFGQWLIIELESAVLPMQASCSGTPNTDLILNPA
jgi:hypothetical protein